jgi:hypothetical protein
MRGACARVERRFRLLRLERIGIADALQQRLVDRRLAFEVGLVSPVLSSQRVDDPADEARAPHVS